MKIGIVGCTGAVGGEIIKILQERDFKVSELKLFASARSVGKIIEFKGEKIKVESLSSDGSCFLNLDLVFFSAGKSVSKMYAPLAVSRNAIVIDNSAAFRMDKDIPLVVPEVNPHKLKNHNGLIANPNCSTIALVVAIFPLYKLSKIKRLVISTYQSTSGTGARAMWELACQSKDFLDKKEIKKEVYKHQIAFNLFPQIGDFVEIGEGSFYCEEELKLINETRKILDDYDIKITATTVRVPVFVSHSLSVNIEFERKITPKEVREALEKAEGVVVMDNPKEGIYPQPILAASKDPVFVGRIRQDTSCDCGINLWVVSDNLRKGAALNAVQIAEQLFF